jgi:DNA segregation ATPase FtsK/SpoIIIE, S-DNA-T family
VMQVARLAPPAPDSRDGRIGGDAGDDRAADHGRAEAEALRSLAAAQAGRPGPELSVGPLPVHLDLDRLAAPGSAPGPMQAVLGLADLEPAPVVVDLTFDNLVVLGEPRSGRSTALLTIAGQLAVGGAQVWAVGPAGSPLAGLPGAHRRSFGQSAAVADVLAELAAAGDSEPRPVLVIDDVDLLEDPALDAVLGRLLAAGVRYVAATTSLRGYSTSPLTQDMKKARSLLYLQPPGSREVQEVAGVNPRIRPGLALVPGRGVLVVKRAARVVQVANPGYSMPWSRA